MNKGFKNMQVFEDHPDLKDLIKEDDAGLFGPAVMTEGSKQPSPPKEKVSKERTRALSLKKQATSLKSTDYKLRKGSMTKKKSKPLKE